MTLQALSRARLNEVRGITLDAYDRLRELEAKLLSTETLYQEEIAAPVRDAMRAIYRLSTHLSNLAVRDCTVTDCVPFWDDDPLASSMGAPIEGDQTTCLQCRRVWTMTSSGWATADFALRSAIPPVKTAQRKAAPARSGRRISSKK